MRRRGGVDADAGGAVAPSVHQHLAHVRVIVNRVRLVPRGEVKNPPIAALPEAAAAHHLAAFVPRNENLAVGLGDVETLAVHLGVGNLKILADALGDGVVGGKVPDAFFLGNLAPLQGAVGAHHAAENLGEVSGVKDDEPHALKNPLLHAVHDFVLDLAVGHVAPPVQDVGVVEHLLGQPVLGLVQRGVTGLKAARLLQRRADGAVQAVGINFLDALVRFLVPKLVPQSSANGHAVLLSDKKDERNAE